MKKSSTTKETTRTNDLLAFFLLFFAVLQGSSQLIAFLFTSENVPPILAVWISLGNSITENWVAVSLSLIALPLGYRIYYLFSRKMAASSNQTRVTVLVLVNLVLSMKLYSTNSIVEKYEFIQAHLMAVIVIIVIVLFMVLCPIIIHKEREASEELDEGAKTSGRSNPGETSSGQSAANKQAYNQSDIIDIFSLRHPISYRLRSALSGNTRRQAPHTDNTQAENINESSDTPPQKSPGGSGPNSKFKTVVAYILSISSLVATILLGYGQFLNGNVANALNTITNGLLGLTGALDQAEGTLTGFLASIGILFLFVLAILALFLLIYAVASVFVSLVLSLPNDEDRIQKMGSKIKKFVFGTIDGVLSSFTVIPAFIDCLEETLFEINNTDSNTSNSDEASPPADGGGDSPTEQ